MLINRQFVFSILILIFGFAGANSCGQRQSSAREFISNGYKAEAGKWPWHGAMYIRNGRSRIYACGVAILSEDFVVTAAHCTIDPQEGQRLPARRVFIKVGQVNLDATTKFAQQHNVDRIIRHEDFDVRTFEDGIALLQLHTEITFSSAVQPICLWSGDRSLKAIVDKIGYMVGWGSDEHFQQSVDLMEATAPIVSKRKCIDSDPDHYHKFYHETKTFCAGHANGTYAGVGDSGGGLYLQESNRWYLRGIISNGKVDPSTGGIASSSYVVFTDASNYVDWIRSYISSGSAVHSSYTEDSAEERFVATEQIQSAERPDRCSPSPCGLNASCRTENNRAICSCNEGYTGNALVECSSNDPLRYPSGPATACTDNSDCPESQICKETICQERSELAKLWRSFKDKVGAQ